MATRKMLLPALARPTIAVAPLRSYLRPLPSLHGRAQPHLSPAPRRHGAPLGIRAYSQDATPSKIWFFEDLQKATQDPNSKIVIVDSREPDELRSTGRIPGAVNIPITSAPDSFHIAADEFADRFGFARPPPDAEVVFYCKAGVRSRAAAALARNAGWTRVGEYPGSWMDWAGRGGKAEKAGGAEGGQA